MDNNPISSHLLGRLYSVDGKQLGQQYKDHLSDFHGWDQKSHADEWMLFEDNIGTSLSIDETALKNLKKFRVESNLSQEALANLSGIDWSTISRLERGVVNTSISVVFALANALKIKPYQLLE